AAQGRRSFDCHRRSAGLPGKAGRGAYILSRPLWPLRRCSGAKVMAKTAFIGLGVMGGPMAGHLANAGHDVAVYNRTEEKSRNWAQKYSGRTYTSVANVAEGADIVFACVGNDRDVREVFEAASPMMRRGTIFVDHTTSSALLARELAERCE